MSHGHERKEKNCLNCGAEVQGRYCQVCGQENIEPHETFFGMVNHFFSDITHFDGKFFKTIGILASKPGFLSKQYISGRRNSYLHPVRMYVFTSALFFLIFFSFYSVKPSGLNVNLLPATKNTWTPGEPDKPSYRYGQRTPDSLLTREDSIEAREDSIDAREDSIDAIQDSIDAVAYISGKDSASGSKKKRRGLSIGNSDAYNSLHEYDSVQAALTPAKRDGWLTRMMVRKGLDMKERYPGEEGRLTAEILNKFLHTMPYMLFVSLPLYGFFLYLLYMRRKRFYFADHAVFLIHLYVFTFLLTLVFILIMRFPYGWLNFVKAALLIYGFLYTVKAFKNFYGQGWGKTITKFILFNILCVISLMLLFIIFFGYAFFQV